MIHIDVSKTYQTIAGFGVTVPPHTEEMSKIYNRSLYEDLLDDLGCSIVRTLFLTQDIETPNPSLLEIQLQDFSYMKSFNPELKVIASINGPPGVMRDGSGQLDPKCYTEFGEYLFKMCDNFKNRGCPIYGFGLQNGPTTTALCSYDRESYYKMFKTLCTLKAQYGYQGKLLATEDECFLPNKVSDLVDRIDMDEQTKACMDVLAVRGNIDTSWHSLMWARRENPTAKLKDLYDYIYGRFFDIKTPREAWIIQSCNESLLWMPVINYTRTVGVRDSQYMNTLPTGGVDLALKICSAMNSGFSSYVYWLASTVPDEVIVDDPDLKDPSKALCIKGLKTEKYQTAKHFFKYVLPGMVRVKSSSEDMVVSAFKSDKIVIVAINCEDFIIDTCVEISGADVNRYTSYTSVKNEFHHQESGTIVGNKLPFMMLPRSIVTFIMD